MRKEVITIANTGKRRVCRCIKTMNIVIGKEQRDLFTKGQVYDCVIRDSGQLQVNYKIYGKDFDLSCTKEEFEENFVLINKKTGVRK